MQGVSSTFVQSERRLNELLADGRITNNRHALAIPLVMEGQRVEVAVDDRSATVAAIANSLPVAGIVNQTLGSGLVAATYTQQRFNDGGFGDLGTTLASVLIASNSSIPIQFAPDQDAARITVTHKTNVSLAALEVFGLAGVGRGGSFLDDLAAAPNRGFTALANEGVTGQAIDAGRFARMRAAFQRNGGVIDQSADAQRYLQRQGAEGLTFNTKTILLPERPTTTAVFEEFIHTAQHRTGQFNRLSEQFGNAEAIRRLEIEAAERLIQNRRAYQIPNAETRQTIQRLRGLRDQ